MLTGVKKLGKKVLIQSLRRAIREQGLEPRLQVLKKLMPDISKQYTTTTISDEYQRLKVYGEHAFQVGVALKAVEIFGQASVSTIVDVGDSSGAHVRYLSGILGDDITTLSVNLDAQAVDRIRASGLRAKLCRAENLHELNIHPDLLLSFETMEHLFDPISFLRKMAGIQGLKGFVLTVPWVRNSRIGLHHIRKNITSVDMVAENTHIFELCPEDWMFLAQFAGWRILHNEIYRQYPRRHVLRFASPLWRRYDFEGFFGMVLQPDTTWSNRYKSW